jgi:hypothetical protein
MESTKTPRRGRPGKGASSRDGVVEATVSDPRGGRSRPSSRGGVDLVSGCPVSLFGLLSGLYSRIEDRIKLAKAVLLIR